MPLTMVLLDARYKDRTRLKVRERHLRGSTRLKMELPHYHTTTMTKGTETDKIWAMEGINSNSNPVLSMTTTKTTMSLMVTAGTQLKTHPRLKQTVRTSMPYPLTDIRIPLISICSLIRRSIKLNVGLAVFRRCLELSHSPTCEIHRRLCLKWRVIFLRYP